MKKTFVILVMSLYASIPTMGQVETDTLYYDSDWKGVKSKAFASYFCVVEKTDDNITSKPMRMYYITGELRGEGRYITIDRDDMDGSVRDGEYTVYYRSGKVMTKKTFVNGKLDGEFTGYKEDGLIEIHTFCKDGKRNGICTTFSEDGNTCYQTEFYDDKPRYDYYIVSNKDGLCSKIRISDNEPVYESPTWDEQKKEYNNGVEWPFYDKNGITVGMVSHKTRGDYGKYQQMTIVVSNNSMFPFDFDPEKITAYLVGNNGKHKPMRVFSAAEYMKKVKRQQRWAAALMGISAGLNAASAGYQTSTVNTYYSGYSRGTGGYHGFSTSTITTYNAAAAYQAQVIASNQVASFTNSLLSDRAAREEGYLKKTTIYPGESISGYVNIVRKKGKSMYVNVDINGAIYEFGYIIGK